MRITTLVGVAVLTAVGAGFLAVPLAAQSLAGVARQEEERRKAIKAPSKVLTNKDLPDVPQRAESAPAAAPGEPSAAAAGSSDEAAKGADAKDGAKTEVKDQAYWAGRQQALQSQLSRDQTYADALQTRINVLSADFVNRDDPVQRAAIGADRQKALDELARLTKQIADDRKAIADFQEEARRAAVPAGWLR
jgi:hypothetical protein